MTTLPTTDVLPSQFVVPTTGEVIDIGDETAMRSVADETPDVLGLMLDTIDDHIRQANAVRAYIGSFLVERMDKDATQTLHAGEYTLTVNGSSDEYETYDAAKIREGLASLVASGAISEAALEKAIRVKYEASKSGINSLRALRDEAIDGVLDGAKEIAVRKRRVTVKRSR